MKGLVLFLIAVCFVVMPVLANAELIYDPEIYDIGIIPCLSIAIGSSIDRFVIFGDASYREFYTQAYLSCDSATVYNIIVPNTEVIYCPNGIEHCIAYALYHH